MFVIGVAGQAQMGKDTLADLLCENLNDLAGEDRWKRAAFAYNVKKVYMDTFDVDMAFVEEWKVKDEIPPGFAMSVRKGLQFIGDGFRKIQPQIWIDLCFRDDTPKIISDVRYINEFMRVNKEGGCNILVGRTDKLSDDPNGSEAMIRPYVEWALNNLEEDGPDQLNISKVLGSKIKGAPEGMNKFDLFVRNDGTIDEFYDKIEEVVVPFVEKFVFKFS